MKSAIILTPAGLPFENVPSPLWLDKINASPGLNGIASIVSDLRPLQSELVIVAFPSLAKKVIVPSVSTVATLVFPEPQVIPLAPVSVLIELEVPQEAVVESGVFLVEEK